MTDETLIWHYGLMAERWAEFINDAPELPFFRTAIARLPKRSVRIFDDGDDARARFTGGFARPPRVKVVGRFVPSGS